MPPPHIPEGTVPVSQFVRVHPPADGGGYYVRSDDWSDYELDQLAGNPYNPSPLPSIDTDSSLNGTPSPRTSPAQNSRGITTRAASHVSDANLTEEDIHTIAAARPGRSSRPAPRTDATGNGGSVQLSLVASGRVGRPATGNVRRARSNQPAARPAVVAAAGESMGDVIDLTEISPEPEPAPRSYNTAPAASNTRPARPSSSRTGPSAQDSRPARPATAVASGSRRRASVKLETPQDHTPTPAHSSSPSPSPAPVDESEAEADSESDLLPPSGEYLNSRLERRDLARRYAETNGDMRAIRNSHPGSRYRTDPAESHRLLLMLGEAANKGQIQLTRFHASRVRTLRATKAKEEARRMEREGEKGLGDVVKTRPTWKRGGGNGRGGRGGRGGGASGVAV
ncbi:hypothetical protein B0T22DRAFT_487083 [Podospora appendiculata]|uniref:Uncharacterized protein n=1 Tax=Podospora appendiculata TaxID=314037 RepID=A0AAE1CGJ8_9PEZI|nr:hypothetical protein B0T22DRAFT_487083 [Podospora appendiculata]